DVSKKVVSARRHKYEPDWRNTRDACAALRTALACARFSGEHRPLGCKSRQLAETTFLSRCKHDGMFPAGCRQLQASSLRSPEIWSRAALLAARIFLRSNTLSNVNPRKSEHDRNAKLVVRVFLLSGQLLDIVQFYSSFLR